MVERVGISLDRKLLERFDELIDRRGWPNRSEAIRDLIRAALVQDDWENETEETVAAVVLVYDHHARELDHRLKELQHRAHDTVVSSMHVHLDHDNCLETIILRGSAREIRALGDALIGSRGVRHGTLVPSTTGDGLA